jgi:hypothetical protein
MADVNLRGRTVHESYDSLIAALAAAGVDPAKGDLNLAGWLSGWEPELVRMLVGWVERAHAAGFAAGSAGGERERAALARIAETAHLAPAGDVLAKGALR